METLKEPVRFLTASIGIAYQIKTTPNTAEGNGRIFLNIWTYVFQRAHYQKGNVFCGYLTLFLKHTANTNLLV